MRMNPHTLLQPEFDAIAKQASNGLGKTASVLTLHRLAYDLYIIDWYNDILGNRPAQENRQPCAARKNICVYPNGDVVKCFDHRRISLAKEPLGNIAKQDIIEILSTKRSTQISKIMKTCDFPCKNMSCNKPQTLLFS